MMSTRRDTKTGAITEDGKTQVVELGRGSPRSNRYETTIGYAANLTGRVDFSQAENVRAYRVRPSADMRVVEDAQNVAQANVLLNSAAAETAKTNEAVDYIVVYAAAAGDPSSGWSEWQEIDKTSDFALSSLWFGLNAAGTGATVYVETR